MGFYLSPQVVVKEVDLSTIIPAVSTNVACIIIPKAFKGPVGEANKSLITGEQELYDTFGPPDDNSYEAWFAAKGYLKHGNQLWVARAMPSAATYAYLDVSPTAAGVTAVAGSPGTSGNADVVGSTGEGLDFDALDAYSFAGSAASAYKLRIFARGPGTYGNNRRYVQVGICNKATYDSKAASASAPAGYPSQYWDVEYGPGAADEFIIIVATEDQNSTVTVQESFLVSTSSGKKDHNGRSMYAPDVINQQSSYIAIAVNSSQASVAPGTISGSALSNLSGGANGGTVTDAMKQICFGYFANPEQIDVNLFIDSAHSVTVKSYLNTVCQDTRKDSMAILDVPKALVVGTTQQTAKLINWRGDAGTGLGNINSSYSALYGNWGKIYDRYNDKYRWIPLAGWVAGLYALTDRTTDPWFAPAGLNRGLLSTDISQLGFNPTLGNRDQLYKNGINPITEFRGEGIPVWGQKTLTSRPSSFDRVNVRRLFLVMEKAISTMAKYYLFEPNDRLTRSRFASTVAEYLEDVKGRRGVYDYMVICDESNNTAAVIDRNEFVADILVKPTRAAEFIVLNFVALRTGASFTEFTTA
jgi:hypothetical protein